MKVLLFIFIQISLAHLSFSQNEKTAIDEIEIALLSKINDYRKKKKLTPLIVENGLKKSAQNQCDYVFKIGKLSHNQPEKKYRTTYDRIRYFSDNQYWSYGENCLMTYADFNNPNSLEIEKIADDMFELWRNSKPHNENLLHGLFSHAGFGFKTDSATEQIYCVMNFGGN